MKVEFSRFIETDLEIIADYIAQDNPRRALSFIQEIRAKFRVIEKNPLIYRLRPEIGEGARLTYIGNYVILFRLIGEVVRIERVIYGGRDLLAVLIPEY